MEPRGIRNNNPGNIRAVAGVNWQGQTGVDDAGFCTFDTAHNGLRALAKVLLNYETKHGLRTVRQIIERYAPPTENNTPAYEEAVAKAAGVGLDDVLDDDAGVFDAMVAGIVQHENGTQPYEAADIEAAVNDALEVA